MTLTFTVDAYKITPSVNAKFAWISFDQFASGYEGTYIAMYFDTVNAIDNVIGALQTMKADLALQEAEVGTL